MLWKRGLMFLLFLLAVPIVSSGFEFRCEDGTLFGNCNEKGQICANGVNLIHRNKVNLNEIGRYLFFAETNESCNNYVLRINEDIILTKIRNRIVGEFNSTQNYNGNLSVFCGGSELRTNKKYLGRVNGEISLYSDFNYCDVPEEFINLAQRYLNAGEDEREKLREEMREKFGLESSFFASITGNVIAENKCADFTGNNFVDFDDFFLFADNFGRTNEDETFDDKFDLDNDGLVSLEDFFLFADNFGKSVECKILDIRPLIVDEITYYGGSYSFVVLKKRGDNYDIECALNAGKNDVVGCRLNSPLILSTFSTVEKPGKAFLRYSIGSDIQDALIYYPEFVVEGANYELYVSSDGSTYWKKNYELNIDNPTFEDAVGNGHIARLALKEIEQEGYVPERFLRFTFENFDENEVYDTINYLCGKDDWIGEGILSCNWDNGNEIDGVYEYITHLLKELPTNSPDTININFDSSLSSSFAGTNSGNEITLTQKDKKNILSHELVHSFVNFRSDVFEEGFAESISLLVNDKLGLIDTYGGYEISDFITHIANFENNNKPILSSGGGFYGFDMSNVPQYQYGLSAYFLLSLYYEDNEIFEKIKISSEEINPVKGDMNVLLNIIKDINYGFYDHTIDYWILKNYVLHENKYREGDIIPFAYNSFDLDNFVYCKIKNNDCIAPLGINECEDECDNIQLSLLCQDFNNNVLDQNQLSTDIRTGFLPYVRWSNQCPSGTVKRTYSGTVNGNQISSTIFDVNHINLGDKNGIIGLVEGFSEGRLILEHNGEVIETSVSGGIFYFSGTNELKVRNMRGRILLRFISNNENGEILEKEIYKVTDKYYALLSDIPYLYHNQILTNPRDKAIQIIVTINDDGGDIRTISLFYKDNLDEEYSEVPMNLINDLYYAEIPKEETLNQNIEYYISVSDDEHTVSLEPIEVFLSDEFVGEPLNLEPLHIKSVEYIKNNVLDLNSRGTIQFWTNGLSSLGAFDTTAQRFFRHDKSYNPMDDYLVLSFSVTSLYENYGIYPESNGDFVLGYIDIDNIPREIELYWPEIITRGKNQDYKLYVALDGSTLWKYNEDLQINNLIFEDAAGKGHLAKAVDSVQSNEGLEFEQSLDNLGSLL